MAIGALDTDSTALATRLELQHRLSSFDLNAWIFEHLPVAPGQRWLDLGCGRGEQTLKLARQIGVEGRVTAVDLSEESLASLREQAGRDGTSERIETVHANLDAIGEALAGRQFDRVVGSYSLYYAADTDALFATIARSLVPGGQLFFCGPAAANNLELRTLIAQALGDDAALQATRPSRFMEEAAPAACARHFASVETFAFANPVIFSTADDLVAYWRSHNLFSPKDDATFVALAEQRLADSAPFINTKQGIGIRAIKG